jgi:hypothetical protein
VIEQQHAGCLLWVTAALLSASGASTRTLKMSLVRGVHAPEGNRKIIILGPIASVNDVEQSLGPFTSDGGDRRYVPLQINQKLPAYFAVPCPPQYPQAVRSGH